LAITVIAELLMECHMRNSGDLSPPLSWISAGTTCAGTGSTGKSEQRRNNCSRWSNVSKRPTC